VPLEVVLSPRANQQYAALTRRQQRTFDHFLDMLTAEGCAAMAYRLAGEPPIGLLCVKHLDGNLRVIVAFESTERAVVALIGAHVSNSHTNIYDELYRQQGVEPRDAKRAKPPCCEEASKVPPVLGEIVHQVLERAKQVRRTRRRD
jgi:hypothetical protein